MSLCLQGDLCVVRSYRPDDAESLAENGNNRKIWRNLRDRFPHPFTKAHAAGYIAHCLETEARSWAIEADGKAVGGISIHPREDVERIGGELGYWVGESYWGRGIATDAIMLVTTWAFRETELIRLFALPFATNIGSCRALEKAGFVREGTLHKAVIKDGEILDQHVYARIREEEAGLI
jgi:RimJ/RimL family protein N-acetyltransferase